MKLEVAEQIVRHIKDRIKGLHITGSIKRKEPNIADIDFLTNKNLTYITSEIMQLYNTKINSTGPYYTSLYISTVHGVIKIDLWRPRDVYEYKFLKWFREMPKGKNIHYRTLAKKKGLSLSDRGLYTDSNHTEYIDFDTLDELKQFLKE
jgi:DNA polymerase/3'-5' exonuclease PolX